MYHLFAFSDSFSDKIRFYDFFESVTFILITICTKQELYFKIVGTSLRYLLQKVWMQVLQVLRFLTIYFSWEVILEGSSKINLTENLIDAEIQVSRRNLHQLKNLQRRKYCRDCPNELQGQITNCNYFHQNMFSEICAIWIIFYYFYSTPKIDFES